MDISTGIHESDDKKYLRDQIMEFTLMRSRNKELIFRIVDCLLPNVIKWQFNTLVPVINFLMVFIN